MNISILNQCEMCGSPHQPQFIFSSQSTKFTSDQSIINKNNQENTQYYPQENQNQNFGNNSTENYNENEEENYYQQYNEYDAYYQEDQYYNDEYDGAEFCDYDDIDWDQTKKRLTRTSLTAKKPKQKKKKKKAKKDVSQQTITNSMSIQSLNTTISTSTDSIISTTNSANNDNKEEEKVGNIPSIKMIYNEPKDSVLVEAIRKHNHKLRIRVMLDLNHDGYCNHDYKAWTFHTTGYNTSYKRYNYMLGSCRIDIYDQYAKKYWDSVTFLPCKNAKATRITDAARLDIVNNASVPIFVKLKDNKFVDMAKRGTIRDMDTCILYYIAQFCLEARLRNIVHPDYERMKVKDGKSVFDMIDNESIKWNIQHWMNQKKKKKNMDLMDYKSPIYHRKLWKIFDKYIPNTHMLFHVIFEFLGYDRITNLMIEGTAELKGITDPYFERIAFSDEFIPRNDEKVVGKDVGINLVHENGVGYDIDESSIKMENGENVKHYMNVAMNLSKMNKGSNIERHGPFVNKHGYCASVWVGSQKPMSNILKKSDKLKTVQLTTGKRHQRRFGGHRRY